MKRAGNRLIWDEKDIEYLLINYHKKTLAELANDLNVSKQTISRKSNELGLCKRTIEDLVKVSHGIEDLKTYLQKAHWEEMLTVQAISKKLGVSRAAIYRVMEKYNIPARSFSEAIKVWWDNASEEQRKKQVAEAHKKAKEIAAKGENTLQLAWKENREEMLVKAKQWGKRLAETRRYNGMKGITGEKHHNWNPNKSKPERVKERKTAEAYEWTRQIYERDNYVCQICGYSKGKILVAHHLNSYADYPNLRYELKNGITLCEPCHLEFHSIYGYGGNTEEQFEEYRNRQLELVGDVND